MTFSDLPGMLDELTGLFGARVPLTPRPKDRYAQLRWPKLLPLMNFTTRQYAAPGWATCFPWRQTPWAEGCASRRSC
jgi:hypothetical protein